MKKFNCVVTRTDEYEVEIDENIMNEKWIENYIKTFGNLKTLKEHVKIIAQEKARGEIFIEGYGVPMVDNESQYYMGKKSIENIGINIVPLSEDEDCDIDVREML
ncbi:hypothetical protein [Clostridium tagluense]|uniref:hypothetical protein n=1 Tax=Clostridium tagluense TaxID=360422 RepID=UPI001C0BE897|nr:hypothetical protein [Clostridium tagluense]MBU3126763.1 hypothetical protein [Clostridium tagluense]